MRVLLLNPPHTAIGSRCVPDDHLPPLGLLSIGGPLIDAGHHVELHDADLTNQPLPGIVNEVVKRGPEVLLIGHTGSTSAHPTVAKLTRLATWVVGFEEERASDYWRGFRQLLTADPDQVQLLYVTPHRWTGFFEEAKHRRVIQTDQRRWDYKHQVLATRHLPPWLVITFVKAMEVGMQLRPKAWKRLFHHDRKLRDAQRWYYRIGRRVWFHEWAHWLFREERTADGPTLEQMWGAGQVHQEFPLAFVRKERAAVG